MTAECINSECKTNNPKRAYERHMFNIDIRERHIKAIAR